MGLLSTLFGGEKAAASVSVQWKTHQGPLHFKAERLARLHGLKGWVRINRGMTQDHLMLEVEGQKKEIEKFIDELRQEGARSQAGPMQMAWLNYRRAYQDFKLRS